MNSKKATIGLMAGSLLLFILGFPFFVVVVLSSDPTRAAAAGGPVTQYAETLSLGASGGARAPGYDGQGNIHPVTQQLAQAAVASFGPMPGGVGGVRADSYKWHPKGLAVDFMTLSNTSLGDQIASWLVKNAAAYNLDHVIWKQSMWTEATGWRPMEDRGSLTQNHFDHVHVAISEDTPPDFLKTSLGGRGDDYPYSGKPLDAQMGRWGGMSGECVDFVGWRLNQILGGSITDTRFSLAGSGLNADGWRKHWISKGWPVGDTPRVGAIAWYAYGTTASGIPGHVAIVTAVLGDQITVEQYNVIPGRYTVETYPASRPSGYLYTPTCPNNQCT